MPSHIDNPGSADAVGRGCTCDLIKNDFGRGKVDADGVAFHCAENCPVHGVLLNIPAPKRDTGRLSNEAKTALDWLRSTAKRQFKRNS
jgi:hypothetical protein